METPKAPMMGLSSDYLNLTACWIWTGLHLVDLMKKENSKSKAARTAFDLVDLMWMERWRLMAEEMGLKKQTAHLTQKVRSK